MAKTNVNDKKYKKTLIIAISSILILLFLFILFYGNQYKKEDVCIGNKACFEAQIADTAGQRVLGLSGRDSLNDSQAMLFIFPQNLIPGFWMKNMKFPVDIIWIDENWKVEGIKKNVQPCSEDICNSVYPNQGIKYVLEVNAGLSDKYGFAEGDSVEAEK